MKPLGDPVKHFWKVQQMAKATGVDLVEARAEGKLPDAAWADTVTNCRGCDWVEGCERFLDQAEDGQATPPSGCVNQKPFEALKP